MGEMLDPTAAEVASTTFIRALTAASAASRLLETIRSGPPSRRSSESAAHRPVRAALCNPSLRMHPVLSGKIVRTSWC